MNDAIDARWEKISTGLDRLIELSLTLNFSKLDDRKRFIMQFLIVRNRLIEIKALITKTSIDKFSSDSLPKYLPRSIHKKQMGGWLNKINLKIKKFIESEKDLDEHLSFIKEQEPLLDFVLKVLNGKAFFIGCGRI